MGRGSAEEEPADAAMTDAFSAMDETAFAGSSIQQRARPVAMALMRDIAPVRTSKPTPIVPGAPMDSRATLHHRLTSLVAGTNQQVRLSHTTNAAAFIIIYSLSR